MKRYHVRECYTPDNIDDDRSREEAEFTASAGDYDYWPILQAALAALDRRDIAGECDPGDCIGDGPGRFHALGYISGGEFQWWISPLTDLPEPTLFDRQADLTPEL